MGKTRILTIQDISCVGRCSLTVALPVISACGVEASILPSAVLSTHVGFEDPFCRDLTDDIEDIYKHWLKEKVEFSAVYTGYLANKKQIEYVIDIMNSKLVGNGSRIVDPAMADHGELYSGFDMEHVKEMYRLCEYADIVLPNITEAALMTGKEYKEVHDKEYIEDLLSGFDKLPIKYVVLKGVLFDENEFGIAIYDKQSKEVKYYFHERVTRSYIGTGDCFASCFCALFIRGFGIYEAVSIAADFVLAAIKSTDVKLDKRFGVDFELAIPYLIKRIYS